MSRSYQRPENALKRANEFIDVGKPSRALEVLYEVIKRGKMRTNYSEKLLEPIMFKYLELCVDLKKSHLAKEGLYQYRNIFQSVNVSSLETVVKFYLNLADDRTESARKESHQAVVDIDDLDNLATPEEILLSAVSGEDAQDRSDRTILTPWVKFLWESYRQCLELLRTNSRVEKLYHNIAKHAFKFCEKYNRKTEFRKLCDNLRTHLAHIQKQQGSATAVNLNNPETQLLNLETRLEQLDFAIKMELWQEAYKAIEDISDLMKKSKKMQKPHVLASYYEKLALVFWKAGNHLFHADALFKLFQLLRDQKKNITPDEVSKRAAIVLVATLAIPLPSAHPEFDRFIETEKSALEKIERLANLLSLSKPPSREGLIKDLMRLNVVSTVPVDLQNMYQLMEVEFDPLHLCHRMEVHLEGIKERPESGLPQYIPALQEMTITRLVKQVGQVYQTITFARLIELSVFMTAFHLERILVDLVRHNDLQIRIDHRTSCVHFGVDLSESQREDLPEGPTLQTLPSETIRCQLVQMSSALQKCLALIAPESKKKEMEPVRAKTIQMYHQTRQRDHQNILQRQHIIEERKEMLENQNLEREEQVRKAQEEQLRRQKDEEQERLRREASKRERERQEEQLKQIHTKQIKDKLMQISKTSYGQKMIEKIDKEELLNLGAEEILQRQVEELEKERKELQKKLKTQEKAVDYFERARRLLEIPRLKKALELQREKDKEFWETQEEERVTKMIEEHRVALEHSRRLRRMIPDKEIFVEKLKAARRSEIQKNLNDFNAQLEVERKTRLLKRKDLRRKERRDAYLREMEEEEQMRRDEELKKQREEEERLEMERSKKEEEERASRRKEEQDREEAMQRNFAERNGDVEEDKTGPWRPKKASAWRQKEQEKLDVWRVKDEEREREPLSERLASRDIRRDEPPREKPRREEEPSWRSEAPKEDRPEERNDYRGRELDKTSVNRDVENDVLARKVVDKDRPADKGPADQDVTDNGPSRGVWAPPRERGERDSDLGPSSDFGRGPSRDFERGQTRDSTERGPSRDFDRGPRDKDFERGPSRNFDRGFRDKDSEFERGPIRDFDRGNRDSERGPSRDYERGPARDFERGPRDFGGSQRDRDGERGPPRDRDFERRPNRDFRGGRDFDRGPNRDFRGGRDRDFDRNGPRDFDRNAPRDFERGQRDGGRFRERDEDRRGPSRADEESSWRRAEPAVPEARKEVFRRGGRGGGGAWGDDRRGGGGDDKRRGDDDRRGDDKRRDDDRWGGGDDKKRGGGGNDDRRGGGEDKIRDDDRWGGGDDKKRGGENDDRRGGGEDKRRDDDRWGGGDDKRRGGGDDDRRGGEDDRRGEPRKSFNAWRGGGGSAPPDRDELTRTNEKREDAWGKERNVEEPKEPKGVKEKEEPKKEPRRPKEETDEDGWTRVRR